MVVTPWVTRLLIANAIVFVLKEAAPAFGEFLAFVPALVLTKPWTIVTYMFVHADVWHIFFNMLGLFFFGPRLEVHLGGRQFILLYFFSGVAGALVSFLVTPYASIIGASGAVYGVFIGFAFFWPREPMYVWGIIPVEARWLVLGMTLLSLFQGITGSAAGIAHFAHLGGFAGGYLYLKLLGKRTEMPSAPVIVGPPAPTSADLTRWTTIRGESLHPVNREELERIRLKIQTDGVANLTLQERIFLDRFSAN